MTEDSTGERPVFLSTLPAGPSERRLAGIVVIASVTIFLAAAPFATVQLAAVGAFIPVYESALVINDLITAALLFGQFRILRRRALMLLACGYLYTAFMTVAHALTFPGLFAPAGLLGAGAQSTAWIYMFWHGGFPILVIAYALLKHDERTVSAARAPTAALASGVLIVLAVAAFTLLTTAGQDLLPPIMLGHNYTPAMIFVVSSVWALSLLALGVLWRRRPHSVLDLWLMVVMCAWLFDIALAAVLNHGRFDLGFYAGRVYGLAAASFVLLVLLLENSALYARLVAAHAGERDKAAELAAVNQELEAFSYSVSHDLRAPLRAIEGFSSLLLEDYTQQLDAQGKDYLRRVSSACRRMGQLIDDLLALARVIRKDMRWEMVDLGALGASVADELAQADRSRAVEFAIADGLRVRGDPGLLRVVLENLLGNAWKFTRKNPAARIELSASDQDGERRFCVRDNGAGFDMTYADKLFRAFQRLHDAAEFPGTGIGLATVQRVIHRHGGRVWADGAVGRGAAFYFTLKETA
jgi:signal transduction histidine kinase